ncbi:MAG: hypothetical protein EHM32_02545 [Spirochaetales bacterium]|nr:MAG: hypothetical protein EHM32_02545 [Spirochaetales bacterium]
MFVIVYENDPTAKGLDEYFTGIDMNTCKIKTTANINEAETFEDRISALMWKKMYPLLNAYHLTAKIKEVSVTEKIVKERVVKLTHKEV